MLPTVIVIFRGLGYERLLISREIYLLNIFGGISNFVHKINQRVGSRVGRTKTELMFK